MKTSYTDKDIQVLSDFEHVRKRVNIYLGNNHLATYTIPLFNGQFKIEQISFIPAVYKAINEIIDNSIDEFAQIDKKDKILKISANTLLGTYTVTDNGRGVPITKHEIGKYTPEVVFGSLRSGRNFGDKRDVGVIGVNGVGSSCVNAVSIDFQIKINRDGKVYRQVFENGAEKVSKPLIRKTQSKDTGTEVTFTLDPEVFEDITLPETLVHNRAIELSLTNPDVTVEYDGHKYRYPRGFDSIIPQLGNHKYFKFHYNGSIEFYVVFGLNDEIDEEIFTWVNSSLLFDGGLCNTQFLNAFFDKVVKHLQPSAKKHKAEVTKNDAREGLLVFGNLKISNPEYDSQSKTRLTGPNLRKEMQDMVESQWKTFARQNKDWLDTVLEKSLVRHHTKANKEAIKEHQRSLRKKVPGLVDATHKVRGMCQLLITEGLSAASMITEARDPKTTASLALTGKVNNVYGMTPAQVLKLGKLTNLLAAIGLIPGKKAVRGELRYGKIVIATDSDHDGDDIFTLLINVFYQFWPELFDPNYDPIVYRLVAPNVVAKKGKQRVHFCNRKEYEARKGKYRGWEIIYAKGLGTLSRLDWNMMLSGKTDTLIPIVDDGNMKEVLRLLFSPNAENRKVWLQDI